MDDSDGIPVVRVGRCLLVSIQMTLHDELLERLAENLARRLQDEPARAVAIDLASVGIIDSFTTRLINQIAAMARLMGVQTVISGIQPAVAITMVEMGIQLQGVETYLSIDQALSQVGIRESDGPAELDEGEEERDGVAALIADLPAPEPVLPLPAGAV